MIDFTKSKISLLLLLLLSHYNNVFLIRTNDTCNFKLYNQEETINKVSNKII